MLKWGRTSFFVDSQCSQLLLMSCISTGYISALNAIRMMKPTQLSAFILVSTRLCCHSALQSWPSDTKQDANIQVFETISIHWLALLTLLRMKDVKCHCLLWNTTTNWLSTLNTKKVILTTGSSGFF